MSTANIDELLTSANDIDQATDDTGDDIDTMLDRILTLNKTQAETDVVLGDDLQIASDVPDIPTEWLWKHYLPKQYSLLVGQSETFKTWLSCYLASIVSTGGTWPNGEKCEKGKALIITLEDTLPELRKRLVAMEADLDNVYLLREVMVNDNTTIKSQGKSDFSLPRDMELLAKMIASRGIGLVILDCASAIIHNAKHDQYVRDNFTSPISKMCEKLNCCILLINHMARGRISDQNPLSKSGNAKSLYEAARCVWWVSRMPTGIDTIEAKVLKHSLGPEVPPLQYMKVSSEKRGTHIRFINAVHNDVPDFMQSLDDEKKLNYRILALLAKSEQGLSRTVLVQKLSSDYSAGNVTKRLSLMAENGDIRRIATGWYDVPALLRDRINARIASA